MNWLYKLEYKYGRRYIRNLMSIIVAGTAIVYLFQIMMPSLNLTGATGLLSLNRSLILQGQVWRLVTFLFIPIGTNAFMLFISLYFYYFIGNALENSWGGFRFNLYYLFGIIGTILASFITGYASNTYLNLSLLLAFASIAPDTQFLLFFILPIKAKWIAIFYVLLVIPSIINNFLISPTLGFSSLIVFVVSLANYLLFFGRGLIDTIKNEIRIYKNRRNWRNR